MSVIETDQATKGKILMKMAGTVASLINPMRNQSQSENEGVQSCTTVDNLSKHSYRKAINGKAVGGCRLVNLNGNYYHGLYFMK